MRGKVQFSILMILLELLRKLDQQNLRNNQEFKRIRRSRKNKLNQKNIKLYPQKAIPMNNKRADNRDFRIRSNNPTEKQIRVSPLMRRMINSTGIIAIIITTIVNKERIAAYHRLEIIKKGKITTDKKWKLS